MTKKTPFYFKLIFFFRLTIIKDNIIVTLNENYLEENQEVVLKSSDEIAVIPPISGG